MRSTYIQWTEIKLEVTVNTEEIKPEKSQNDPEELSDKKRI